MSQIRVSIRSDLRTGALDIHAVGPDGALIPVNVALAVVTSAQQQLLIMETMARIEAKTAVQPYDASALEKLPRMDE